MIKALIILTGPADLRGCPAFALRHGYARDSPQVADVADKYKVQVVKVTSAARIALIGIKEEDVDAIWADLGMDVGNVVGICVRSVKACPGTTYCKRGQQDSLTVGLDLDKSITAWKCQEK